MADVARATISSLVDPVIVYDRSQQVILANEAAGATFGTGNRQKISAQYRELKVPPAIARARDAVLEDGEPRSPESLREAVCWNVSGSDRYFLVNASPLSAEGRHCAGAIVVARDVTRFWHVDAIKNDVVATVSHELKTPLTSLRLATHLLLENSTGPLHQIQRELATVARDETWRLQRTVDELLDLAAIERGAGKAQRAPVSTRALFQEATSTHRMMAAMKQVSVEVSGSEAYVEVDGQQMTVVLSNLVSNAVRHSRVGGHVWLTTYSEGCDDVLCVRDDGEGMAPDELPRVFDRHWSGFAGSTRERRHGLGLAIAKEIAARHGATLEVEAELGAGSTFRLRIPRRATDLIAESVNL